MSTAVDVTLFSVGSCRERAWLVDGSRGGGDFVFRGQVGAVWDEPARREREVTDLLHKVYPALKGVKLEGSWRGPVTRTPTGLPFFGAFVFTPERRASDSPIAMACFADFAPCLPSRM